MGVRVHRLVKKCEKSPSAEVGRLDFADVLVDETLDQELPVNDPASLGIEAEDADLAMVIPLVDRL